MHRFQVRATRTGNLEADFRQFGHATEYAESLQAEFGGCYHIIDSHLPPSDDRIIWRQGPLADEA